MDQGASETAAMKVTEYVEIFGYGSLVNRRARRSDLVARPVRIGGWRRSWSHCVETENGNVCALTVVPQAEAGVAGVGILERRDNLAALDAREKGYRRIPLALDAEEPPGVATRGDWERFTYISTPVALRPGSREFPIWRSYLECVLAGFLDLGGGAAARDFIVTTDGWEAPILDDRAAPKYMRAVKLPQHVQGEVDALIQSHELHRTQFADPAALLAAGQKVWDVGGFG
jgi:hypothetical protein